MDRTLFFLIGPTASGKSKLAFDIAKQFDLDIISCDSAQIYRKMNIGTAKPTAKERLQVVHHMIDIADIDEDYNVSNYVDDCNLIISKMKTNPFIVGGTGLYVKGLLFGYNFSSARKNTGIRDKLTKELREFGADFLYDKLKSVDEKSALSIHKNNTVRVMRALEIFYSTGKPKSSIQNSQEMQNYKYKIFAIDIDRAKLYERINSRVDIMIQKGLVDEVAGILEMGYSRDLQSLKAIGYKEIISYLLGECSLEDAISAIKINTRHYAKRQITWIKHQFPEVIWVKEDDFDVINTIMSDIVV